MADVEETPPPESIQDMQTRLERDGSFRMVIAHRMLLCIQEQELQAESTPSGEKRHDSCFPRDE